MKGLLACLTAAVLLAGCGGEALEAPTPGEDPSAEIRFSTEWTEYADSVRTIYCIVTNGTGEPLEFGLDYDVERLDESGAWRRIPWRDGYAVESVARSAPSGESVALTVNLDALDFDFPAGEYRVVKNLGGGSARAAFALGDSVYSAETPYGYEPLERLPEDYSAMAGREDAAMVLTGAGLEGQPGETVFLNKVRLGIPCQLRVVRDEGGVVTVTDTIYENGHFLWRLKRAGAVTEQRFSFLVTDGKNLCLSNGADWAAAERHGGKELVYLLPEGIPGLENAVSLAERMTADRLAGNVTRYKVWSADGVWSAALTDAPTEFFVSWQKPGEGAWGRSYDLQNWDGLETAVTGLQWREEDALELTCETAVGGVRVLRFDPETETLTETLCGLPVCG